MRLLNFLVSIAVPFVALKIAISDHGTATVYGHPALVREFHHKWQEIVWPGYRKQAPKYILDGIDKERTSQEFAIAGVPWERAFYKAVYKTIKEK